MTQSIKNLYKGINKALPDYYASNRLYIITNKLVSKKAVANFVLKQLEKCFCQSKRVIIVTEFYTFDMFNKFCNPISFYNFILNNDNLPDYTNKIAIYID